MYSGQCKPVYNKYAYSVLKGNATNFTHYTRYNRPSEYCSHCQNCSILSSVVLEELCQVRENNPADVITMSSGLLRLGFRDYKFITESLCYKLGVWVWKEWAFTCQGWYNKKMLLSCILGNVGFGVDPYQGLYVTISRHLLVQLLPFLFLSVSC